MIGRLLQTYARKTHFMSRLGGSVAATGVIIAINIPAAIVAGNMSDKTPKQTFNTSYRIVSAEIFAVTCVIIPEISIPIGLAFLAYR